MGNARNLGSLLNTSSTIQADDLNIGQLGNRNKIINGAMTIDQRNAGAAVTINNTGDTYTVDRFYGYGQETDGVFTLARSTVAPQGFVNSALITVTTADASIGASQFYGLGHKIEGYNIADLGWGAAGAKTVTLSFWVRSSVTGTFGGAVRNGSLNRSYPFSYTISSANIWEQKSIIIAGDTTGTWSTDSNMGLLLSWSIGDGSSRLSTAGAWAAGNFAGATGQTNLIATNGATFYLTGVQLEAGDTATPFEHRSFGQELALCMRYYEKSFDQQTAPAQNLSSSAGSLAISGVSTTAFVLIGTVQFAAEKRVAPTMTTFNPFFAGSGWSQSGSGDITAGIFSVGTRSVAIRVDGTPSSAASNYLISWTASAEL